MRLVHKTPETWPGALLEMWLGFMSRSVVIGEYWYVFKRGRGLLKLPASQARGGDQPGIKAPGDVKYLDSLVGAKWSLQTNCITVFSKIWRRSMQSNADDRNAIAKSVVIAMLMLVMAGGGFILGIQKVWIDPNVSQILSEFESAKRSRGYYSGVFKEQMEALRKACE